MPVPLDVSDDFIRRITESIDLRPCELPINNPTKFSEQAESVPKKKFHNEKIELSKNFIRRITESIDLQPLASNVRKQHTTPTLFSKKNRYTRKNKQSGGVIYINNIKELDNFNIHPTDIFFTQIKPRFSYNNSALIDYGWLEKQLQYIYNLSDAKKSLLHRYTNGYDKIINNYLRNTSRTEQNETIEENIQQLDSIIENSPLLEKNILLFRAICDDSFLQLTENREYLDSGYVSTSIYLESAVQFLDKCGGGGGGARALLEIYNKQPINCLFIAGVSKRRGEYEVLLLRNTELSFSGSHEKYILNEPEYYNSLDIIFEAQSKNVRRAQVIELHI